MKKDNLEMILLSKMHHFSGYMHRLNRQKRGFELGRGQGRLLRFLAKNDGISQQELAELVSIQAGSMSELIKKMENKNYIKRERDPEDGRRFLIYITDQGRKVADSMIQSRIDASHEIFSKLSTNEQQTMIELLDKLLPDTCKKK